MYSLERILILLKALLVNGIKTPELSACRTQQFPPIPSQKVYHEMKYANHSTGSMGSFTTCAYLLKLRYQLLCMFATNLSTTFILKETILNLQSK